MATCPICKEGTLISRGSKKNKEGIRQQYKCNNCGKYSKFNIITRTASKILLLDIETSLMEFYGFSPKNDWIPQEMVIKDWSIICWNAKWLFDSKIEGAVVTSEEAKAREDKSILKRIWELLDEADIVVTQNGKKFDLPKLNTKFLLAGYSRPMYYQIIDTLEILKKDFSFSYNGIDYVNQILGIDGKSKMTREDWIKCALGDENSLKKMLVYNKKDVEILEEMYLRLRPWIPSHANLGIYVDTDSDCCPNCQSIELRWAGQYATPLGLYEAFRCLSCGAIGRSTKKKYKIKGVDIRG